MKNEKYILMASSEWSQYGEGDFPIGIFETEAEAEEYGVTWLEHQPDTDMDFEDFCQDNCVDEADYLDEYGLWIDTAPYCPTVDEFEKARLRKEINDTRAKLNRLEASLALLEK